MHYIFLIKVTVDITDTFVLLIFILFFSSLSGYVKYTKLSQNLSLIFNSLNVSISKYIIQITLNQTYSYSEYLRRTYDIVK